MKKLVKLSLALLVSLTSLPVVASQKANNKKYLVVTTLDDSATRRVRTDSYPIPGTELQFTDPKTGAEYTGRFINRRATVFAFSVKGVDPLQGWKDRDDQSR